MSFLPEAIHNDSAYGNVRFHFLMGIITSRAKGLVILKTASSGSSKQTLPLVSRLIPSETHYCPIKNRKSSLK